MLEKGRSTGVFRKNAPPPQKTPRAFFLHYKINLGCVKLLEKKEKKSKPVLQIENYAFCVAGDG